MKKVETASENKEVNAYSSFESIEEEKAFEEIMENYFECFQK